MDAEAEDMPAGQGYQTMRAMQTDGTATAWVGKRQTLKDGLTAPPAVVAASLKARALGVTA
jgi:hypothetical protein